MMESFCPDTCDYIIAEHRSDSTLWQVANKSSKTLPILTPEWAKQCLINQRIVPWQSHTTYTYKA
jgi:hypothetical protein